MPEVVPMSSGHVRHPQVLFCYEQFDELTLLHLREFDRKKLISVETDIVVDHYKEEKFEDTSPGLPPTSVGGALRVGWARADSPSTQAPSALLGPHRLSCWSWGHPHSRCLS